MNQRRMNISASILIVIVLSSCTSIPINPGNVKELFPDTVPSNICYLRTVREARVIGVRRGFNATGTLIEGQYIITAGHNLYDSWRTRLVGVQVICKGENGEIVTTDITENQIKKTRKVDHYNQSFSSDYAFLKLKNPMHVRDSIHLNKAVDIDKIQKIEVAGYPGGKLQYGAGNLIRPIPINSTFYYEVDTAEGMSGGPVWAKQGDIQSLVGIHVSGKGRSGGARVVDNELIDDFDNWKKNLH